MAFGAESPIPDPRNIDNGREISAEGYADQPYIVKTDDGAWLVCLTQGSGREGEPGQHVATYRSTDQGRTWKGPVAVEPPDGPEASYAVMLKVPSGRVYVFYNHNTDNIRRVKADTPSGWIERVDSLGYFVFKYSDDGGRSWSAKRYPIPVREFEIDRNNVYGGKIRFFWNVGKAFTLGGAGYVPLIKVGGFGEGFFTSNEGALLRSDNILTEHDPERIRWETLPEGDVGLRSPPGGGPIAAEQSYSALSDGSLFAVYRTIDGYPAFSYSRDGGRTWDEPQYMRYADGRLMKHPRAANFAWRASNGKYLYWFHNHGGRFIREAPDRRTMAYQDRNPVWLSGGVEADSPEGKIIRWSQPEIALYDDDPFTRMSYPDFVEDGGKYFLTETEKVVARVHEIDPALLEGLWKQFDERHGASRDKLLLESPDSGRAMPAEAPAPRLPTLRERDGQGSRLTRQGFSVDVQVTLESLDSGQMLLDATRENGQGWRLATVSGGAVEITLNDGRSESRWRSDRGMLDAKKTHRVTAIVDGGPCVILFVVDGRLADGGDERRFGWGRFSPELADVNGSATLRIGPAVRGVRVFGRALRVSEAVGPWTAGIAPRE